MGYVQPGKYGLPRIGHVRLELTREGGSGMAIRPHHAQVTLRNYRYTCATLLGRIKAHRICEGSNRKMRPRRTQQALSWAAVIGFSLGICLPSHLVAAEVRVWEDVVTIATYPWEDDINPKFWALEGGPRLSTTVSGSIIYPYTMQDHLSRTKVDRQYRAVFLENEYLRVMCLPELGGRLHSVYDKAGQGEMFHLNRVIKPGMIAMRGAWISGGVEWNAGPQGHTVTCLSPVDVVAGRNPDGSAFIEISNQEKIFRTRWTVRVTLRPARAYLEEDICIFNPTDGMHPYYFWNCTAFPNRPGTRFIFPMSLGTDHHGREFFRWPIHNGRDLSWLKNYETWASVFAYQCTMDFFGAYDVDADRGVVAIADHRELPGKKAWTWGQWEFGQVAQQNLTDEDGPYIEVQSGPLPTQSDYGLLWPRQRVAWREWWYPVHGLGDGFEFATRYAAVQTARVDGNLELRILSTAEYPRVRCRLEFVDGSDAETREVGLSPRQPARLRFAGFGTKPVNIVLETAGGMVLLAYRSPLEIPQVDPPDPAIFTEIPDEEKSAEQLYLKGRRFDRDTNRLAARRYYELALARDPGYTAPLRALAILDLEGGQYSQAAERLQLVLRRDPDDGFAWYALGVCQFKMGLFEEAMRTGYWATRFPGCDALGYDLSGRAAMRLGDYSRAVELFRRAVRLHPEDAQAQIHLIVALRAAGVRDSARQLAQQLSRQAPTLLLPQWALVDERTIASWAQRVRTWNGEYNFNMTEAALTLSELGRFMEAAQLLRAACWDVLPPQRRDPMAVYLLAYLVDKIGEDPSNYLEAAPQCPREFVFASRPEELPVLEWVVSVRPGDAYAHFQLGNLLANLGQVERAIQAWKQSVKLDPKNSIAWRNLGLAAVQQKDWEGAEACYRQAIAARPDDQTLYRDLAEILTAAGRRREAIELLENMPYRGMPRADVIILLAQYYVDEKRWTDAVNLLESTPYFVNWEGQDITWRLFHQALVARGIEAFERGDYQAASSDFEKSLTYPPNLGVGRSNRPPEAKAQFWRGKALEALDRKQEALQAWQTGGALPDSTPEQNQYRELCRKAAAAGTAANLGDEPVGMR